MRPCLSSPRARPAPCNTGSCRKSCLPAVARLNSPVVLHLEGELATQRECPSLVPRPPPSRDHRSPSCLLDRVFVPGTIVFPYRRLEFGLAHDVVAALCISHQILVRVESVVYENLPPLTILTPAFRSVERVIDTADRETHLVVSNAPGSVLPLVHSSEKCRRHAAMDRGVCVSNHAPRHVMVRAAQDTEIQKPSDLLPERTRARPRVPRVSVGIGLRRMPLNPYALLCHVAEASMRLQDRPEVSEIGACLPRLDYGEVLQLMQRLLRPVRRAEFHICIDPRNVLPIRWE